MQTMAFQEPHKNQWSGRWYLVVIRCIPPLIIFCQLTVTLTSAAAAFAVTLTCTDDDTNVSANLYGDECSEFGECYDKCVCLLSVCLSLVCCVAKWWLILQRIYSNHFTIPIRFYSDLRWWLALNLPCSSKWCLQFVRFHGHVPSLAEFR
jgi:hypothetical protein